MDISTQSILFVTSQLRQREIKLAYALKSLGWRVDLIYYKSTPFQPDGFFDDIYEVTSAKEAYKLAKKHRPKIIHVFSGAIDDYILLFCNNKIAPVVIDLNDVFTASLMDYCPERFLPTKAALALADGFCARDLQIKCAEKYDECELPSEIILFPEYCWNKNHTLPDKPYKNEEVHLVSIGTISLESYGMFDCCYLELAEKIINQNIHFHIYPPWCYRKDYAKISNADFEKDYADFIVLAKSNSYLHIHDSLPIDLLANELPQYDFGIISGGCREFGQRFTHFKPSYVESCYSGRISDYLDAGLPILINDEVAFNYWLLKRYHVSIDLKDILQSGFKQKLVDLKQTNALKNHVSATRNKLSIYTNAKRLEQFYLKILYKKISYQKNNSGLKNLMGSLPDKIKQILQL